MLAVVVQGGTNAGRRIIRKAPQAWLHVCATDPLAGGVELEACIKRCPRCGCKRPTS